MKFLHKRQGVITVFVTLIMVPIVVFTGTMVDLARMKLYGSLAVIAADSYGEAVLSEYDNILKQMYGLFSVTQSDSGKKEIEELTKYSEYGFNPNGDNCGLSGFMPYKNAEVSISYSPIEGAALSNPNVLLTQISEFMKFRVVQDIISGDNSVLEAVEQLETISNEMDAVSKYNNLSEEISDSLECIADYYDALSQIKEYPLYLDTLSNKVDEYNLALKDLFLSDDYKKYYVYCSNKEAIDNAVEKKNALAELTEEEEASAELTEEEEALCEQYVDIEAFQNEIFGEIVNRCSYAVSERDIAGINISFNIFSDDKSGAYIRLAINGGAVEKQLEEINRKLEELNLTLDSCSEEFRQSMGGEIEDIEEISRYKGEFSNIVEQLHENNALELNAGNKENMDSCESRLNNGNDGLLEKLMKAELNPDEYSWQDVSTDFSWWDFYSEDERAKELYESLKALCENTSGAGGNRNAADSKKSEANNKKDGAINGIQDEEEKAPRDIPKAAAEQLKADASHYDVPGIMDYFSKGVSLKGIGGAATQSFDKLLLISYDFGMFSSRVTGIEKEDEKADDKAQDNASESPAETAGKVEVSLTGIPKSDAVNYLYGSELEYLYAGQIYSESNLKSTRNMICAVRMALNYVSTYSIDEINTAIKTVSESAASAVAATGAGAPFAPVVKLAVSGALRAAVAGCETAFDWKDLKKRKEVILYKNKLSQLSCVQEIKDLIGLSASGGSDGGGQEEALKLDYEEYVWLMLFTMVDTNNLVKRTGNLVTLNINWCQEDGEELAKLDFTLADTVTAVNSTCTVKEDFVIVPRGFIQMFLNGSSAQAQIGEIEDEALSYSIIRGY